MRAWLVAIAATAFAVPAWGQDGEPAALSPGPDCAAHARSQAGDNIEAYELGLRACGLLPPQAVTDMPAPPQAGDEAAVRAVADQMSAAWAAGDADGFVGLFTADADFMAGGGVRMTGRDAIWDLHAGAFEGIYAGSTFPLTVEHVTFITADVALLALTGRVEPAPGKEPVGIQGRDLLGTAIARREPEGWRIAYMNTMPAAAPDFQPPSAAAQAAEAAEGAQ